MPELALRQASARVEELGRSVTGTRPLRRALLEEIARHLHFDAYAWLLTDPETAVGCDPVAEVPCLAELPKLIRLKYATETNRWTHMAAPVGRLSETTHGNLGESLLWRELLASYDVVDLASIVFRDGFGCWGFLDLWRVGASEPFSDRDSRYLKAVVPTVTAMLRRAQAETFHVARASPGPEGPAVLVLSPDLQVRAQTPETEAYLRALVPPAAGRQPIPAGAYNVGAQLHALEQGVDDQPPRARVHFGEGVWLTLRAARIGEGETRDGDIAVTIEPTSAGERMRLFSLACGLTRRESEIVAACARGADTRGLARELFVSQNTVQDHFKSIFAKTGTRTRGELLAIARGG